MARKATGAVVEHIGRDGRTYRALRFTAYGKRRFVSLGPAGPEEAARALRHALADVERGTWQPPQAVEAPPEPEPVPTFHQFAEQWWVLNVGRLRANTRGDYRRRLENHLLPHFAAMRLDEITYDTVETYIAAKLAHADETRMQLAAWQERLDRGADARRRRELRRERPPKPVGPRTINMSLILLTAILESAVERDLIAKNPAKGKRRRAREHQPQRTTLDSAEAIAALLDAAGALDAAAREDGQHVHRRAILAVLLFGGLRIGEACDLRWRNVDLATGWLTVGHAKTDAGSGRRVKIRGALRDVLLTIKPADASPDAYVFATRGGGRPNPSNLRNRVLIRAVEIASEQLVDRGGTPLPHLTPHSCRRTFASVLYALGEAPPVVMAEMGHTSPNLALRIYAQAMRRTPEENERLRALVEGREVAVIGSPAAGTHDATADTSVAFAANSRD
jgi:integrase